jgi:MFS family permease
MSEQNGTGADHWASQRRFLFAACFVALVATSFAFIIRVMVMDDWQVAFALTETQKGEIFGAGMWPFGVSIVLFSLVLDKLGYGKSMIFAFFCHAVSTVLLIAARGYWGLYIGSVLNGLAAGTVEAVINPAIATMYPKRKTAMLTVLHAGWPSGLALGGMLIMLLGGSGVRDWRVQVGVILIPVVAYGLMLLRCHFPVSERVAAGIPYRDMLREAGAVGALIVTFLITKEVGRVFSWPTLLVYALILAQTGVYFAYARSLGRPLYTLLLLLMILLAITELGTDTWIKDLMTPSMGKLGLDAGWVLIYTATIMTVLRFCISPIEKALRPLGVLLVSSLLAAVGLFFLSKVDGVMILVMATIYGTGQCFFWPVTLGLVAEQFPRGGALTLNAIAGVGMLGVGILGGPWLGYLQDTRIDQSLREHPAIYETVMSTDDRVSVLGHYRALDGAKVNAIQAQVSAHESRRATGMSVDEAELRRLRDTQAVLARVGTEAKQNAMATVAILPLIMALTYLGLILYFRSKGGYRVVELTSEG